MKFSKIFFAYVLIVVMLLTALPVSAAEKIGDCRVFFSLANNTGGDFIDEVTVIMTNSELNLEYTFKIQYIDYMLNYDVGGSVKKGEYTIAFEYLSKDKFVIKNADGTPFSDSFIADMDTYTFEWAVEYIEDKEPEKTESKPFVVNEEADVLYQRFIELLSPMISTNKNLYYHIRTLGKNTIVTDLKLMEKNDRHIENTGRTADEWLSLSVFERYIGYITVIKPYYLNIVLEWDGLEDWNEKIVINERWFHDRYTSEELFDAYDELSEWSYSYFEENGVMFDFLKNAELLHDGIEYPYIGENFGESEDNVSFGDIVSNADESYTDETVASKDEAYSDIESSGSLQNEESEKGIWDEPLDIFMHSIVFFLVAGIIAAIITGIVLYRRRQS